MTTATTMMLELAYLKMDAMRTQTGGGASAERRFGGVVRNLGVRARARSAGTGRRLSDRTGEPRVEHPAAA